MGEAIKRITEPVEMMLPDKLLSSLSASGERVGGEGTTEELPTMHDLRRYVQLLVTELERVPWITGTNKIDSSKRFLEMI